MGYQFYNANALGKLENDCFIRALSCSIGKSWDYTYDMISNEAQRQGTMMDDRKFVVEFLDDNFERMPKFYGTLSDASNYYKDSIVLITTKGHIVCSKYGVLYDTWNSSNREVEYIWLVR